MLQNQGFITALRGSPRLLFDCKLYRHQEIKMLTNRTTSRTSIHCNQQMSSWKKFLKSFVKLRWGGTRVQRYSYHHWCSQPLGHASYKQWRGRESRNMLEIVGLSSNEISILENTFYFPFEKWEYPCKVVYKIPQYDLREIWVERIQLYWTTNISEMNTSSMSHLVCYMVDNYELSVIWKWELHS